MTLPVSSYLQPPFSAASPCENISNNVDEGKFEFKPGTSSCVQLRRNQSRCYGDLKSIMSELLNETADLKTEKKKNSFNFKPRRSFFHKLEQTPASHMTRTKTLTSSR